MRSLRDKVVTITALCGFPENTGVHAARNLGDHWPQPGRGHKNVPLQTSQAISLVLALCGPPGDAASYVDRVGGLRQDYVDLVGGLRRSIPDESFSSFD